MEVDTIASILALTQRWLIIVVSVRLGSILLATVV